MKPARGSRLFETMEGYCTVDGRMYPSEWAGRKIEVLAHHYPVVWIEDPYHLASEALAGDESRVPHPLSIGGRN